MPACSAPQPPPGPAPEDLDLRQLLDRQGVVAHFQPLLSLRGQFLLGVEALCRGVHPTSGQLVPPQRLFARAHSDGLLIDLDRLCRRQALTAFRELSRQHPGLVLNLNFEAALLDQGVVGSGHLLGLVRELGLDPGRIVIELVESRVADLKALERFVETHKGHGFLLALDDVGTGHSNLERIAIIKPDVLKIDRGLISGLDRHYHKQEVTRALLNLAGKIGALVVAEGVEREEEALLALEMGVDVLQGYYLARPGPGPEEIALCQRRGRELAARFRQYTVETIAAKKAQHQYYQEVMAELVRRLRGLSWPQVDQRLAGLVEMNPWLECLYVLDEEGQQLTRTACQAGRLSRQRGAIFWPAAQGSDQSLKNYFLLLKAGLERYVSEPYISRASGNLCLTISTWFVGGGGQRLVLCADFAVQAPEENTQPGQDA
ncbi:MAG: EAL domain-containing protein [Desulfarculus sp.]|nr:EAL domain-containing protein [Desulfarculus sp.]